MVLCQLCHSICLCPLLPLPWHGISQTKPIEGLVLDNTLVPSISRYLNLIGNISDLIQAKE